METKNINKRGYEGFFASLSSIGEYLLSPPCISYSNLLLTLYSHFFTILYGNNFKEEI